jgi:hydrogenase-4 component E
MVLDNFEALAMLSAVLAILILGTTNLKTNLVFYSLHTMVIAAETAWIAHITKEDHLYWVALGVFVIKTLFIPFFLSWVIKKVEVDSDTGAFIAAPLSMHLGALTVGLSYLISNQIPGLVVDLDSRLASTAAMSILFTGVLLMLTRRAAISQILGFLVLENGIYLFAVTQTHGMPLLVEMGLLLEVLVAVMVAGLLLFNIKKSFEHIDVSQLTELKD